MKKIKESIKVYNKDFNFNFNKTEKEWQDRIKNRVGLNENEFLTLIEKGLNSINEEDYSNDIDNCILFFKSKFILVINYKDKFIVTIRDMNWKNPISKDKECKRLIHNIKEDLEEEYVNYYVEYYNNNMDNKLESMYFEDNKMKIYYNCNCIKINY